MIREYTVIAPSKSSVPAVSPANKMVLNFDPNVGFAVRRIEILILLVLVLKDDNSPRKMWPCHLATR
jgi:hypothetical protein